MDEARKAELDITDRLLNVMDRDCINDAIEEINALRYQIDWITNKVIFPLAMIDRDNMTEHDEALLEEAIERAKELYDESRRT